MQHSNFVENGIFLPTQQLVSSNCDHAEQKDIIPSKKRNDECIIVVNITFPTPLDVVYV